jgi:hypothetical protein
MKTLTLFDGITIATLISLAAAATSLLLGGFIVYNLLFELMLYGGALGYLLYLLQRSRARVGRIVVLSGWAAASLAGWFFDVALLQQVLIQAGLIWLVRSLYFHSSIWGAAIDFGLVSAGLAAAGWALFNTGSLVAALWSFFLVQAFFSWLPQLKQPHRGDDSSAAASRFQSAHRVAIDAVRKLSQP